MVTYLLTEYQFLLNEALSALQYQTLNNRIGIKYMCFFSVEPESRRRRLAEKARITELAPLCTYPVIEQIVRPKELETLTWGEIIDCPRACTLQYRHQEGAE